MLVDCDHMRWNSGNRVRGNDESKSRPKRPLVPAEIHLLIMHLLINLPYVTYNFQCQVDWLCNQIQNHAETKDQNLSNLDLKLLTDSADTTMFGKLFQYSQ